MAAALGRSVAAEDSMVRRSSAGVSLGAMWAVYSDSRLRIRSLAQAQSEQRPFRWLPTEVLPLLIPMALRRSEALSWETTEPGRNNSITLSRYAALSGSTMKRAMGQDGWGCIASASSSGEIMAAMVQGAGVYVKEWA